MVWRRGASIYAGSSRIVKWGSTDALRMRSSASITYVAGMRGIPTGNPCGAAQSPKHLFSFSS